MKQVNFRQKKCVQPRQSIQKSLIKAQRVKRQEIYHRLKETSRGEKKGVKNRKAR
ncbi:MAG: hypothetical protein ACE5H0_03670 [Bacteroidota bacterium]